MKKLFYCLAGAALLTAGYLKFGDACSIANIFSNYQIDEPFVVNFTYGQLALEEFSDGKKPTRRKTGCFFHC